MMEMRVFMMMSTCSIIYIIKKLRYLENLHLYHLKINEDIEAMFPDAEVFIE